MRYNRCYPNLGISLVEKDLFLTDEKHDGKYRIQEQHILYMLNRTQAMFDYKNLPDTIPQRNLEIMLQLNGNVFFTEVNGQYYVFTGGLGGEPDVYYEPTIYTVANPALNFSKNLKIGEEGVLIRSDSFGVGLLHMFRLYAALQAENDITMRIADINARIPFLISATDDRTKKSADKFIQDIENGKLSTISDNPFFDGLKVNPTAASGNMRLTDLIEYQQYIKASWFNELGINANYNMKREAISPGESQLNDDALLPLIDDMLEMRRVGLEEVNKLYNLDIQVTLSSSWLKEQLDQMTPGADFDSDLDEHINEFEPETAQNDILIDETIENTSSEETTENEPSEDVSETPEETPEEAPEETEDIKDDLEDIKEDLEDIKEDLEGGEDDENSETE